MFSSIIVVTNLNIKPPSMQFVFNPGNFCAFIGRFFVTWFDTGLSLVERSALSASREC